MYSQGFENLASHYEKLAEFYYTSWLKFKKEVSPSEGGSYKNIEVDPSDRVPPALLAAHIHVRERQNKSVDDT